MQFQILKEVFIINFFTYLTVFITSEIDKSGLGQFDFSLFVAILALLVSIIVAIVQRNQHIKSTNANLYKEIVINKTFKEEIPLLVDKLHLNDTTRSRHEVEDFNELRITIEKYTKEIMMYEFYDNKFYKSVMNVVYKIETSCTRCRTCAKNNDVNSLSKEKKELLGHIIELYSVINKNYI